MSRSGPAMASVQAMSLRCRRRRDNIVRSRFGLTRGTAMAPFLALEPQSVAFHKIRCCAPGQPGAQRPFNPSRKIGTLFSRGSARAVRAELTRRAKPPLRVEGLYAPHNINHPTPPHSTAPWLRNVHLNNVNYTQFARRRLPWQLPEGPARTQSGRVWDVVGTGFGTGWDVVWTWFLGIRKT